MGGGGGSAAVLLCIASVVPLKRTVSLGAVLPSLWSRVGDSV